MRNEPKVPAASRTDAARAMIQETQTACDPADWPAVLELLRVLALLVGDYPSQLLYAILGKSEDEVLRLAAQASGLVQTTDTGKMILRPPEVGEMVVSTVYSSQSQLADILRKMAHTMVASVGATDSCGDYCGRHLGKYLEAAGDPQLTLEVLGKDVFGRLLRSGSVSAEEVVDLLLFRARSAQELNALETMKQSLLMAGSLARTEQSRAASGDVLLELWRTKPGAGAVAAEVPCSSTPEGVVLLLALTEAAAHVQGKPLLGSLDTLCSEFRRTLKEKPNDCVVKVLNQRWGYTYAGEVVAALADRDSNAALQVHEVLLLGAQTISDVGALFDYSAHLLSSLAGHRMTLGRQILKLAVDRSIDTTPALPESLPFPLSAIDGRTFSLEDREEAKRAEGLREQFLDATRLLRKVRLPSKEVFQKDLKDRLDRLWKEDPPAPCTRIDHLIRFYDAVDGLPDKFLTVLAKDIREELEGFHISPYDECRNWLKACRILGREKDAITLRLQVIEAVMKYPLEDILFQWPLVTEFNFCTALLQTASAVGPDKLKDTWERLWAAAGKLKSRSGQRLAGIAKLLAEGSAAALEALHELMLQSLSRARFSEKEQLALRASLSGAPGDGADRDRCRELPASLVPVKSDWVVAVPSPSTLARFLAMCLNERLIEPLDLASSSAGLASRYGLSDRDRLDFLILICQDVLGLSERRAMLNAIRGVIGAQEHLQLCLELEELRPGTLTAGDLNKENTSGLSEDDFARFLDVGMSADQASAAAMVARIPSVQGAAHRALLIHKYIKHAKKVPQFQAGRGGVMPLPADKVISGATLEAANLSLDVLNELESFAAYDLAGFRLLHGASAKVTGPLPETFVARQVERLIPSLRTRRENRASGQIEAGDQEQQAGYHDGVQMAEEILRCGDVESQFEWIDRIIDELPGCGRYPLAGFLDTIARVLKCQPAPKALLAKLETLPEAFEEKYRPAFYGRIIHYLGDLNSEARKSLWVRTRSYWFADVSESVFKRAARLASRCDLLPPAEIGDEIRQEIGGAITDILNEARSKGGTVQAGVLALLLWKLGKWRGVVEADLGSVLGAVLDSARSLRKGMSDAMMTDLTEALAATAQDQEGFVFLERVCSSTPARWAGLLEVFGGRCDSDGDLDTHAEELVEQLVTKVWPGEDAVRDWLACLEEWGGSDRMLFVRNLAPAVAANPQGEKWAEMLDQFMVSTKPDPEEEHWQELIAYGRGQVACALFAKDPGASEGLDKFTVCQEDCERVWRCLRDAPDAPLQKEAAVALFTRWMEQDPPQERGKSGRGVAIELASKIFGDHEWRFALAESALDVLRGEKSIAKRLQGTLAIAEGLKSAAALRAALDLLTDQVLVRAMQGATFEDLKVIIGGASMFQVRSLYLTIDGKEICASSEGCQAVQRHAVAYRRWFLGESTAPGPSLGRLKPEFQTDGQTARLEADAFVEKDVQWARDLAAAVAAMGGTLRNEDLPVQYWWRLTRCARVTQSPELTRLLVRLRHGLPKAVLPPGEVTLEFAMILHDGVNSPGFPEQFGLVEAFLTVSEPGVALSSVGLAARLQRQLTEASNLLN